MRKFRCVLILITLTLMLTIYMVTYKSNKADVFSEIENNINVKICDAMVQANFYEKDKNLDNEEIYNQLVLSINENIGQVSKLDDDSFDIVCKYGKCKGNVNIFPYKNSKKVFVNLYIMDENVSYENLKNLKNELQEVLSPISSEAEYSLCVRSKILSNTIEEAKEIVLNQLNVNDAKEIDVAKINNGYSIISDTGIYENKKVLNKNIDFNCAIVKYSSGCYLIMGTPEITLTY